MDAIIDKTLNILTKQTHKITQSLIVLFIFAALFPKEAIKIKDILYNKLHAALPASITDFFVKLRLSQKDLLTLWAFLLVIFAITVLLDFLNQLLKGHSHLIIRAGSEKLFEINSIFLLSILIHNKLYNPGIIISSKIIIYATIKNITVWRKFILNLSSNI